MYIRMPDPQPQEETGLSTMIAYFLGFMLFFGVLALIIWLSIKTMKGSF